MNGHIRRVALVTGANKGIGFEIARRLGAAGIRVLVGARDTPRGERAAADLRKQGFDAGFIRLDLVDPVSIAAAAAEIEVSEGRLDVLVNNAGIAVVGDGSPGAADPAAVRAVFETNVFGTLAVVQAMLPLLERSASGRIVNQSSGLGSLAIAGDPTSAFAGLRRFGYAASKAALNMLTVQLAAELAGTGIKVNSADPGYTATDLNGHRGSRTVAEGAEAAVRLALSADDGPTGGFFSASGGEPW